MTTFEHELGAKVRDKVHGTIGVVTGRVEYIGGRVSYGVEVPAKGNHTSDAWYDPGRLMAAGSAARGSTRKPRQRVPKTEDGEEPVKTRRRGRKPA